jgi:hypothetical protein
VVQKAGDQPEALLHRVRDLLGDSGTQRAMNMRKGGERRAAFA